MGDVQKTGYSLRLIELPNDNASSSNPLFHFTESYDKGTNHSPDIIDLTDEHNQHVTSNIPVIDLTDDDDHFLNYTIPVIDLTDDDVQDITNQTQCIDLTDDAVQNITNQTQCIDLTDDDVQDITNQTQCIDLTYNDASSNNHTIQNFYIGGIDDRGTNHNMKLIDLTLDDIQDFNPNTSVTDLTCDDDRVLNFRIRCTDMTNDEEDITHQLQKFDITDGKQQSKNDCIPTIDLKIHNTDMTREKDCNNDRRQIIDSIRNDGRVIRKLIDDDVGMYDLSSNNSHTNFQDDVIENNLRIPATNLSYMSTENDFLKYNETENMNAMHTDTFSSMQKFHRRRENLENHPLKNSECRKETSLTNHPPRKNYEEKNRNEFDESSTKKQL